jgi:hypothetical protein
MVAMLWTVVLVEAAAEVAREVNLLLEVEALLLASPLELALPKWSEMDSLSCL